MAQDSKCWDEAACGDFTDIMEEEIKDMLEESDFQSKFVNSWVEQIVDVAQKKLKEAKKPKFRCVSFRIAGGSVVIFSN